MHYQKPVPLIYSFSCRFPSFQVVIAWSWPDIKLRQEIAVNQRAVVGIQSGEVLNCAIHISWSLIQVAHDNHMLASRRELIGNHAYCNCLTFSFGSATTRLRFEVVHQKVNGLANWGCHFELRAVVLRCDELTKCHQSKNEYDWHQDTIDVCLYLQMSRLSLQLNSFRLQFQILKFFFIHLCG